jgi:hypothetical protein
MFFFVLFILKARKYLSLIGDITMTQMNFPRGNILSIITLLPEPLCRLIEEYKDRKEVLLQLLQNAPLFKITLSAHIGRDYDIFIQSNTKYKSRVDSSRIYIGTKTKACYTCRNLTKFWEALENYRFTKAKIFGKHYLQFEFDLLSLLT